MFLFFVPLSLRAPHCRHNDLSDRISSCPVPPAAQVPDLRLRKRVSDPPSSPGNFSSLSFPSSTFVESFSDYPGPDGCLPRSDEGVYQGPLSPANLDRTRQQGRPSDAVSSPLFAVTSIKTDNLLPPGYHLFHKVRLTPCQPVFHRPVPSFRKD